MTSNLSLKFVDRKLSICAFVILFVQLSTIESQLSARCRHTNANYVWSQGAEIVQFNKFGNLVIFTESESICAYSLDINSLLPTFVSENGKKISDSCDGIVSAVKSLSLPVNSDLGYVLVYNRTLYYSVEKAGKHFGTIQINSTVEAVNMQFVMPNMDKWVKERFSDGSYEAIINIETAESSPSYASALISQATANKSTMLIFLWSEPHSGKGNARIVGTYDSLIHGLYVNPATYRETMTVLAFSESYYGRMVVQMKSDSASSLIIAPRLPVQGITGCPIHLCWWPVFNEIVYHPGLRMYLLFQGKWLFVFPEGSPSHIPSLNVESVIDMAPFNLHFLIYAAYYDGHFKKLALIAKEGIANGVALFVDIQKRGTSWALKATSAQVTIRMVGTRQVDILSAEYIDPGEKSPKVLWIAVKKKDTGQILLNGCQLSPVSNLNNSSEYKQVAQHHLSAGHSMTAMFYHPLYGHLFILAGFFLYVYERPEMKSIETTRCSVTYAHRWFNCSSSYYDMTRFNGKRPVFTTKEEYFSEARRHHSGTFTPGQCNFFPDMPLTVGKISFTEKRFTDDPNVTSAKLRLSLVNLLALAFIACALLLVCFCLIFGTLRKGKAKLVGRHGCLPGIKKRREMLVKKKSGKGVMIKKREKMENAPRGIVESRMTTQTTSSMVSESSSESNKIGKHNKKTRKSRLKNRLKSSQPPPFGAPKKCPSNGMSPSTATSGSSQQGNAKPRGKHERVSPKTGTGLANRSR